MFWSCLQFCRIFLYKVFIFYNLRMNFFSLFASNLRIFVWIIISFLQFLAFQHIHIRFKDVWIFFSELFWTQKITHLSYIWSPSYVPFSRNFGYLWNFFVYARYGVSRLRIHGYFPLNSNQSTDILDCLNIIWLFLWKSFIRQSVRIKDPWIFWFFMFTPNRCLILLIVIAYLVFKDFVISLEILCSSQIWFIRNEDSWILFHHQTDF